MTDNRIKEPIKDRMPGTGNAMKMKRMLIITNEEDVSKLLSTFFESKYYVLTTSDGIKALQMLGEQEVSLIISDVMIRGIDGYTLCKMIKASVEYSHIPVVQLSNPWELHNQVSGAEFGADVYIEKPLSTVYLDIQIRSLLESRSGLKVHFTGEQPMKFKSEVFTEREKRFQETLEELIDFHISNPLLDVKFLARKMHMSRPLFYRKAKALCNDTPYKMIDQARLKRAAILLSEGRYKLNDISIVIGFNSPAQFSKSFKRRFGVSPSEYAMTQTKTQFLN